MRDDLWGLYMITFSDWMLPENGALPWKVVRGTGREIAGSSQALFPSTTLNSVSKLQGLDWWFYRNVAEVIVFNKSEEYPKHKAYVLRLPLGFIAHSEKRRGKASIWQSGFGWGKPISGPLQQVFHLHNKTNKPAAEIHDLYFILGLARNILWPWKSNWTSTCANFNICNSPENLLACAPGVLHILLLAAKCTAFPGWLGSSTKQRNINIQEGSQTWVNRMKSQSWQKKLFFFFLWASVIWWNGWYLLGR